MGMRGGGIGVAAAPEVPEPPEVGATTTSAELLEQMPSILREGDPTLLRRFVHTTSVSAPSERLLILK